MDKPAMMSYVVSHVFYRVQGNTYEFANQLARIDATTQTLAVADALAYARRTKYSEDIWNVLVSPGVLVLGEPETPRAPAVPERPATGET